MVVKEPVAQIKKNQMDMIHVNTEVFHGHKMVDVRVFTNDRMTRNGVSLKISVWKELLALLPGILDNFESAPVGPGENV